MLLKTAATLLTILLGGILFIPSENAEAGHPAAAPDSLDLKIGQMVMMGINERTKVEAGDPLLEEIQSGKLGGILLFEKNIASADSKNKLKALIDSLQKKAAVTLFVTIDEEGGKVHRLKEKYGFVGMPSAAYLGKLDNADSTLFYNRRLAAQLAEIGINLNYAPVLDLAVNPKNVVIVQKERSFSKNPDLVSKHALLCIQAHHEHKVKTILKHFPGHGSSTGDSHLGMVDVSASWSFSELLPYWDVLQAGQCDAIMTAHLVNRNWDSTALPGTLSHNVVSGMLRNLLGYEGVVFSDDMQMHAISKNYGFEKSLELAINAGVDVVMYGNNVDAKLRPVTATEVHAAIKQLVLEGKISRARIDEAYKRIMKLKNGLSVRGN